MKKYFIGVALFLSSSLFASNCGCQFVDGGVYTAEDCPCILCLPDATVIEEPAPCGCPEPVAVTCPTVEVVTVKCEVKKPTCDCCSR